MIRVGWNLQLQRPVGSPSTGRLHINSDRIGLKENQSMANLFDLTGRVFVVTGATGVLAGAAADYLATCGARVAYVGRTQDKLDASLARCRQQTPKADVMGIVADVLDRPALERGRDTVTSKWGRIDGLLNAAGGNQPGATVPPDKTFADLDFEAFRQVVDLNLHGTVLPTLVMVPSMISSGRGTVVNYSSASAAQAVTRVVGYSAAKGAVENFTRWLAVDLARRTSGAVRVNALVPGFFLAEQNRRLLTNEDGSFTARGQSVISKTPFGRFGAPQDLFGAIHYLLSDASSFVTGISLPVDGGFGAFSGV